MSNSSDEHVSGCPGKQRAKECREPIETGDEGLAHSKFKVTESLLDRVLRDPAERVRNTLNQVRLEPLPSSADKNTEFSLVSSKGLDLNAENFTYGNPGEVEMHKRVLENLDEIMGITDHNCLPNVLLDCQANSAVSNTIYAVEDIPFNLNLDRAERYFLSNINSIFHSLLNTRSSGEGDEMPSEARLETVAIKEITQALRLRCSRGENCSYKTHYFPTYESPGPVVLPNNVTYLLKYGQLMATSVHSWMEILDWLVIACRKYIDKAKSIVGVSDVDEKGDPNANNLCKEDNPSRDEEGIFICVCCLLSDQSRHVARRDPSLVNRYCDQKEKAIADYPFRFKLVSYTSPIKYGVSFGHERVDVNYATDYMGLNARTVVQIEANFSVYSLMQDPHDGWMVVKLRNDNSTNVF